jgi:hypothetical protein
MTRVLFACRNFANVPKENERFQVGRCGTDCAELQAGYGNVDRLPRSCVMQAGKEGLTIKYLEGMTSME